MPAPDPREVLTRPAPAPALTVRYGPLPDHIADVWVPAAPSDRPMVLFIHGGFWRAAYDRAHVGPLCADLATRGWVAVALEFRRTGQPGGGWPGTFEDIGEGVRDVPGLVAAALTRDARYVLAGHSAGGHLALWASSTNSSPGGVLGLAPAADLTDTARLGLDDGAASLLMGGGPLDRPAEYAAADPMLLPPPVPPVTLIHGTDDRQVPVEFSRRYAALTGCRYYELAGVEHFGLIDPQSDAWPTVVTALDELAAISRCLDDGDETVTR